MYAVHDSTGRLVSTGTVIADPLPPGLTARLLTEQEAAWLAAGGQWDAAARAVREPAPAVPDSVTPWQIRRWLMLQGVGLATIEAVIDAIPDPAVRESVRLDWEWAEVVQRSHPMLVPLAAAIGVVDLDTAFLQASRLGT
jgi:hypothetical protein